MPRFLNSVLIKDTTDCTGTNTGSLQTLGGFYAAKQGRIDGILNVTNSTASTSTTNGALVVGGGVGVGGAVWATTFNGSGSGLTSIPTTALLSGGSDGQLPAKSGTGWVWATPLANPMSAVGDLILGGASGSATRFPGNITTSIKVLTQTGTGSASATPVWSPTTGSGSVVLATSPVLVSPNIDHATGISLQLTGSGTEASIGSEMILNASDRNFSGTTSNWAGAGWSIVTSGAQTMSVTDTQTISWPGGNFQSLGFLSGQNISLSGFSGSGNNSTWILNTVGTTTITVTGILAVEGSAAGKTVKQLGLTHATPGGSTTSLENTTYVSGTPVPSGSYLLVFDVITTTPGTTNFQLTPGYGGFSSGAISVSLDGPTLTFTRVTGSFLTNGFVPDINVNISGFTNPVNNSTFLISSVTDLTLIVNDIGVSLVSEGPVTVVITATTGIEVGQIPGALLQQTQAVGAVGSGPLSFASDAAWTGTINNISLKFITPSVPVGVLLNSDSSPGIEIRTGGGNAGGISGQKCQNTFVGYQSGLTALNTSSFNAGFGTYALASITSGVSNTAIGNVAGASFSSGSYNTCIGDNASAAMTTGVRNNAMGYAALGANIFGNDNVALGFASFNSNQAGSTNTIVGASGMYWNFSGSGNVALGYKAGFWETASNSLYIDNQPRANLADGRVKALIYGTFASSTAGQQLTINAGTINLGAVPTLPSQPTGYFFAAPPGGGSPAFRALLSADYPVFGASGGSHAQGAVPDPGSSAGTTRYLREDGSWNTPPGGGSSSAAGTTTVNFGVAPGSMDASVVVTGQTSILSTSVVRAWVTAIATADHNIDEHWVDDLEVIAGNIVVGTGFTIYAKTNTGRSYGSYTVQWTWQ